MYLRNLSISFSFYFMYFQLQIQIQNFQIQIVQFLFFYRNFPIGKKPTLRGNDFFSLTRE